MKKPAPPTRVVARVIVDTPDTTAGRPVRPPRATRVSRVQRGAATVLMGLMITALAIMGVGGGAQSASAMPWDGIVDSICGVSEDPPAPLSTLGEDVMFGNAAPYKGGYANHSVTAYEEYGLSGVFWSDYKSSDNGCDLMNGMFTGMLANQTFMFSRLVTGVTIATFQWATDPALLEGFMDPLDCIIAGCGGGKGLMDTLFLTYLLPIIVFGAVWGAWNGLFKKRTMQTVQGGLWMFGATTFALIFLAQPSLFATQANLLVGNVTTTVINGVGSAAAAATPDDDPCWIKKNEPDRGSRMATCSMWKAMLYTPWVAGQFGSTTTTELPGVKATIGNRAPIDDIRLAQLDSQTVSRTERASGSYEKEDDNATWEDVRAVMDDGVKGADNQVWSGLNNSRRLTIALASVVASACLGALVILISFSTVVMAVGMILLMMMAPVFLLIGIHPGFGRGIALKWLELLVGTVFKRIVLGAMLAILVGMYQVILGTTMPWMSQVALIIAMGVGAVVFRKPMLDTLNVIKLGGSSTGMESGLNQAGKKGMGGTVGALAGGYMAGKTGGLGAVAGGAFKGGVTGSRTGSPLRAVSMGGAAGRRVGGRERAEDAREDREDAAEEATKFGGGGKRKRKSKSKGGNGPSSTAERDQQELDDARAEDATTRVAHPDLGDLVDALEEGGRETGEWRDKQERRLDETDRKTEEWRDENEITTRANFSDTDNATSEILRNQKDGQRSTDGGGVPRPLGGGGAGSGVGPRPNSGPAAATPMAPAAPASGLPTTPPQGTAPRPTGVPTAPPAASPSVPEPTTPPPAAQAPTGPNTPMTGEQSRTGGSTPPPRPNGR